MSSRKSDQPPGDPAAANGGASAVAADRGLDDAPAAGVASSPSPGGRASGATPSLAPRDDRRSDWLSCFRANAPIPLLLLCLIPLGWLIESRDFDPYDARIILLVGYNVILAVGLQIINGFSGQFSLGHAGFMAVGAYLAAYPALTFSNTFQDPGAVLVYYLALGVVLAMAAIVLFALFTALRRARAIHPALPAPLMLALLAWVIADVALGARRSPPPGWVVWTHAAGALRHAFDAIMAHAGLASRAAAALPAGLVEPACFVILLLGGGAFAAAAGLVVGLPTLRLRGDYLAIATLGMGEIIRIAITNSQPLGGALGLNQIPRYTNFAWLYGAVIVSVVLVWRLAYSARGRAIQAVREDEIAAAAIGINPVRQKVLAFVSGAFLAGVAGALYALREQSINPDRFGLYRSIEIVVIVTLGGLGSISGAILAAIVLTVLPEALRGFDQWRMVVYSLLLIVMMVLRPQGLLGGIELPGLLWRGFGALRRRVRGAPPAPSAASNAAGAPDAAEPSVPAAPRRSPAALEARGVSRRFGGLTALANFSLRVDPGELVAIIGPNGAGKTTAFNLITGVYSPSAGQIELGGRRLDGLAPAEINRAGVARTFQNIRLFKNLSVLDNVAAAFNRRAELGLWRTLARSPGFYRERRRSRDEAMRLLAVMDLHDVAAKSAGSLPYGQQRRLEIARALASGPDILLLDEPAAGMNPREKIELMDLIRSIRDRFRVGVLLIEHDMRLVMSACQRITVLDHGETIAVGAPDAVRDDPAVIEAYLGEPDEPAAAHNPPAPDNPPAPHGPGAALEAQ